MKFAIACGGTGGHLFPGLAVAEVLRAEGHEVLLFVSEKQVDERALQGHPDLARVKLPSIGLPSPLSPAMVTFLLRLRESLRRCGKNFDDSPPDAVLGMGGFTSIAPLIAAWRRGIPAYLHESNAIPGKANRLAARFCRAVLLGFGECAPYFPKRVTRVTGTPIRSELVCGVLTREQAAAKLGLDPAKLTLLVMGGSQGASGINALMTQAAKNLTSSGVQVVHLAGSRDAETVRAAYQQAGINAAVIGFCDRMQEVYPVADAVVSRSGAASLGEIAWFALPSLLVPFPHAAEDHQSLNAAIFERVGAARVLPESGSSPEVFAAALRSMLESPETLAKMSDAAGSLAPRGAAEKVAAILTETKE